MIVVDSSVWIDHFRNAKTTAVHKFRGIEDTNRIRVADLVRLELLLGAQSDRHAAQIRRAIGPFSGVRLLDYVSVDECAANYRFLRSKGVTIRKSIDLIIGSFCIRQRCELLHDDRDFTLMAEHLALRIY